MTYQAILFNPDGDFVTDFTGRKTKDEVWNQIEYMGSRWIFYPICFVATDITIVDTPEGMEFLKGKRIKTVQKYFKDLWEENADQICEDINAGLPLELIYN